MASDLRAAGQLRAFSAGLALLVAAALGAKTAVNFLPVGWVTDVEVAIEEVGELLGVSVMLIAGLATLQRLVTVRVALRSRSVDAHVAPH